MGGGGGEGVRNNDLGALVSQFKILLPLHCFSTVVYHCVIACVTVYYYRQGSFFEMVYMYMQCMLHHYVHGRLILTTMHVFGVVTLIFFLIIHQACWTRHFIWNPIGACDVAIASIKISVIAIGFSMTVIIIIVLSNMFTCIIKYQIIERKCTVKHY